MVYKALGYKSDAKKQLILFNSKVAWKYIWLWFFFSLQTLTPSKDKLPRQLSLCIDVKNLEDFLSAQLILKTSFDLIYSISFFLFDKSHKIILCLLLDNNMIIHRYIFWCIEFVTYLFSASNIIKIYISSMNCVVNRPKLLCWHSSVLDVVLKT